MTQPEALYLAEVLDNATGPSFTRSEREAIAAELRRLYWSEVSSNTWIEKTEWVQQTLRPRELGMHRADALRARLESAEAQRDALLEALKLARSIIGHPDDAHTKFIDAAIAAAKGEKHGQA